MLFMVIEHFRNGDASAIGKRFRQQGRMLPDDVQYVASWVDPQHLKCFQVMEAPSPESLEPWITAWQDLVAFEVIPVETSAEFWSKIPAD